MPARTQTDIERFNAKIVISELTGCHEFTSCLSKKGYGRFTVHYNNKRVTWQAHRWIFQFTYGSIQKGLYILHKCDNRCCVNPDHLYAGTQFDNMKDMYDRGRDYKVRGIESHKTYFTDQEVSRIKGLSSIGISIDLLTKIFKSNRTTIWGIAKGRSWAHIPIPQIIGKRSLKPKRTNNTGIAVNMLDLDGNFIKQFRSAADAANYLNRCATGFREVVNGRQPTWGGYKWEYAANEKNAKYKKL